MSKEKIAENIECLINDIESQINSLNSNNGDSWDMSDVDNWYALRDNVEEIKRYIDSKNI
jgi:hypothetical protein